MHKARLCAAAVSALCATLAFAAADTTMVGAFSAARPGSAFPEGWAPLDLQNVRNRTRYALVNDAGKTVLRAESNAPASGTGKSATRSRAATSTKRLSGAQMFNYPAEKLPFDERRKLRMVIVESGIARVKRWVDVERDVYRDFRAAFGEDPPAISVIAVATDTDNTGETVTAWYDDISLHKRAVSASPPRRKPAADQ